MSPPTSASATFVDGDNGGVMVIGAVIVINVDAAVGVTIAAVGPLMCRCHEPLEAVGSRPVAVIIVPVAAVASTVAPSFRGSSIVTAGVVNVTAVAATLHQDTAVTAIPIIGTSHPADITIASATMFMTACSTPPSVLRCPLGVLGWPS